MINNKMQKVINELNKASKLYYNGKESFLTDKEYDIKLEELKKLEQEQKIIYSNSPTINVGAPVLTELNKVQIKDKPMLSLDKVHSAQEIINFSDGYDMIASIKCDGLSTRLIYEDGKLFSANTRGNGYQGGDVTEHVKQFLNVPLKINKVGRYIIDGESVILQKDFEIINKDGQFKNPRNTASGSLALLDTSIVKQRRLSFIAWDIIEGGKSDSFYHYNLEEAEDLGFTVVPTAALDCTNVLEEQIDELNKELLDRATEMGIPCDGVVWRINDIKVGAMKGQTAHHFLNAIAWKPQIEEYETELIDIEWSMGRTGVLTPVAIFEPIEIDGTTVERASLHNVSVLMETLGDCPYINEYLTVAKMNMIIPQITSAHPKCDFVEEIVEAGMKPLYIPDRCPYCGGKIELIKSDSEVLNAVCTNPQCEGKLINRLDHFCGKKGLDIKGLSEKTLEKLIDWEWVNDITDIPKLKEHRAEWISKPGFGQASVDKILKAIDDRLAEAPLSAFISGLGIPLVGTRVAKQICEYVETWAEFKELVEDIDFTFEKWNGFGYEMNKALKEFDYSKADAIVEYITFKPIEYQDNSVKLDNKIFVITGKLKNFKNRDELVSVIENAGGKVASSVTSKTNYLINNDVTSTSAKSKKAKELNIPIITEEDLMEMIK